MHISPCSISLIVFMLLFCLQNQDEDHGDENKPAEEENDPIFPRRKLESNWDRYEESERKETNEDVPTQRGTDYHVLLSSAGKILHITARSETVTYSPTVPLIQLRLETQTRIKEGR